MNDIKAQENWLISEEGFSTEKITERENRFFCGNGYLGIRGSLQEFRKEHLPAINLSGIYDKVGEGWREPLNAPNALYAYIKVNGVRYSLPDMPADFHEQILDYHSGIVKRKTIWNSEAGTVNAETEYFACIGHPHIIAVKYTVTVDPECNTELVTGIDGDVWDINGPHYDRLDICRDNKYPYIAAISHEKKKTVAVGEALVTASEITPHVYQNDKLLLRSVKCKGRTLTVEKLIAIVTSQDSDEPIKDMLRQLTEAEKIGFSELKKEQILLWEKMWEKSRVVIDGDPQAERAINYSLYHLMSIAPRHSDSMSIPARGLSGQTYKGAVFWDTEMFMLEFFLDTDPEIARTLLKYRIDSLEGAQRKASEYGYSGAFYAWESQEGGFDACSDYNVTDVFTNRPMRTYFRDKQIHISAAVVYGIMRYVRETGDDKLLFEGGARVIVECARFYDSALLKKVRSSYYELRDVIGPDEYHERVDNNGYTNRMAKFVFEEAYSILKKEPVKQCLSQFYSQNELTDMSERFLDDMEKLYIPSAGKNSIIPQFDDYFKLEDADLEQVKGRLLHPKEYWGGAYGIASHTQIIKQADVAAWLAMFPDDLTKEEKWKNWCYYEPRTEHGSSLSACMYGILACQCGRPDKAYPFFIKSASADLEVGGKEWAGNVYIGGTHPAAAGGAYMMVVQGFAGLQKKQGTLTADPQLPSHWKLLEFNIQHLGKWYKFKTDGNERSIHPIEME